MDQSLVHTLSWGNSYGPMVLKVLVKFRPTVVLVHVWLFPVSVLRGRSWLFSYDISWPGPSAEMCQGFLLHTFWRILPGIFLEDFSGKFLPTKMRRENPATKSAKKSGGPKIEIREKSVLPKTDPNISFGVVISGHIRSADRMFHDLHNQSLSFRHPKCGSLSLQNYPLSV